MYSFLRYTYWLFCTVLKFVLKIKKERSVLQSTLVTLILCSSWCTSGSDRLSVLWHYCCSSGATTRPSRSWCPVLGVHGVRKAAALWWSSWRGWPGCISSWSWRKAVQKLTWTRYKPYHCPPSHPGWATVASSVLVCSICLQETVWNFCTVLCLALHHKSLCGCICMLLK